MNRILISKELQFCTVINETHRCVLEWHLSTSFPRSQHSQLTTNGGQRAVFREGYRHFEPHWHLLTGSSADEPEFLRSRNGMGSQPYWFQTEAVSLFSGADKRFKLFEEAGQLHMESIHWTKDPMMWLQFVKGSKRAFEIILALAPL